MYKHKKASLIILLTLLILTIIVLNGWQSIQTFINMPEQYHGNINFKWAPIAFDATKKNVFIVANIKFTEAFDMIAPFYLFNTTGKANVFIVAEKNHQYL